ncbi:LamG-like jellyroll fold domain-containing protein, partial [Tropicimonas aquimaris]
PAYGIVATTADIAEAVRPTQTAKDRGKIKAPSELPVPAGSKAANGIEAVFAIPTEQVFDGDSRNALIFDHSDTLELKSGTVALSFTTGETLSYGTLFSKDASDYGKGGHLTTYVEDDGDIVVRLQTKSSSHWMVAKDIVEADSSYDLAVRFGSQGLTLFVDGVKVAYDAEITQKLNTNTEALIVGASGASNTPGTTDRVHSSFNGTIEDFAIYDRQLTSKALYGGPIAEGLRSFAGSVEDFRFSTDDKGWLEIKKGGETETVYGKVRFLEFDDLIVRPEDVHLGDAKDEELRGSSASEIFIAARGDDVVYADSHDDFVDGGDGNDRLYAGAGDDIVFGGDGDDYIDAGKGEDIVFGGLGRDEIKGGEGNDMLHGGLGDDAIFGNSWGSGGLKSEKDTAVFDGNYADYLITAETYYNSSRGSNEQRIVVTDSYNGGLDSYYEGRDLLYDIDRLKFADQVVQVADIL